MGSITPDPSAFEAFARDVPDGRPIVMINLLRFRERAALEGENISGRESYERYGQRVEPFLKGVGGRPIWRGKAAAVVIGPAGESWDEAILVEYPSRGAFERMVTDPGYQSIAHLRSAALADSRLIATIAP
jgi:uncharacterized protein (DUF1330 family)